MAALIAYRHVLRSVRLAFQGDIATLTAARFQARQTFEHNRNLEGEEAKNGISHAEDVARILRENIVQGIAQEQDKQLYSTQHGPCNEWCWIMC